MSNNDNINQAARLLNVSYDTVKDWVDMAKPKRVYTEAEARALVNGHIGDSLTAVNGAHMCPFCPESSELKPLDNNVYQCDGCGYKGDFFDMLKHMFNTQDDDFIRNMYGASVK